MSHLGFLPIMLVILTVVTFGVSYIIAVIKGDVSAVFPYISDTGSEIPESCIFGQFLNIAACLAFCTIYVRYKAVEAISSTQADDRRLRRLNIGALVLGIISSLGCSIVANFQEGTSVETVHIIGAGLTFGVGILYCFLQTALTFYMHPQLNGRYICKVRLAISLTSLAAVITTVVSAIIALHAWHSKNPGGRSKFKWSADDPGYVAHVVSTGGEWVAALAFLSFFFTYVREFDKFEIEIRTRPLVQHLDQRVGMNVVEADERTKLLI